MSHSVRRAHAAEQQLVADVLTEAFAEDPIIRWILPLERNTEIARGSLFAEAARMYLRNGRVETTTGLEAVALWGQPDAPARSVFERFGNDVRALFSTFRAAGTALGRAIQLYQTLQQHRPRERHWYLSTIGTRDHARGQGAASSLLAERLAACDAEGVLAYLESSNEANLALYQRHGFEVVEKLCFAVDAPPLWPMRREPRGGPTPGLQ